MIVRWLLLFTLLAAAPLLWGSVDDSGLEAIRKSAEADPPGQKGEYQLKVRVTGGVLASGAATETTLLGVKTELITANSSLTSILSSVDGLEASTDGIETLITSTNTKLDSVISHLILLEGYTDGLEGFVDGIESLIGSTNTKLDTANSSLSSIDTKLSSQATAANQVTANTHLANIATSAGQIDGVFASGTLANNATVDIDVSGLSTFFISVRGISAGAYEVQMTGSVDGVSFDSADILNCLDYTTLSYAFIWTTANFDHPVLLCPIGGYKKIRLKGVAVSGTVPYLVATTVATNIVQAILAPIYANLYNVDFGSGAIGAGTIRTAFSNEDRSLFAPSKTYINYYAVAAAAGSTGTETAITLTKASGTSATSTGTSFVVTSGKKFRINNISVATRGNSVATAQSTTFNLRINTAGAVTTSSTPIVLSARSATPAVASEWDRLNFVLPNDGYEIAGDGTLQFGITAAATYTTNAPTWDVTIMGYEY